MRGAPTERLFVCRGEAPRGEDTAEGRASGDTPEDKPLDYGTRFHIPDCHSRQSLGLPASQ
jgi:hypothetical protein